MANIFSGMFGGGASNSSAANTQYAARLKEWEDLQEYKRRNEDLASQSPAYARANSEMTPERKSQMDLYQMMAGGRETGDKGLEMMATSYGQRGMTIADQLKQDLTLKNKRKLQDYKVKHPEPANNARLEYVKAYIGEPDWSTASDEQRRIWMDQASRGIQIGDLKTTLIDLRDPKTTYDVDITGEVEARKGAETKMKRLGEHRSTQQTAESTLRGLHASMEELIRLEKGVGDYWTTGLAAAATSWMPESDARDWENQMDTVNAQTVIDTMKELKSLSPSGATGFGAVNIAELQAMMNRWGKIDQFGSDERIKEVIEVRKEIMLNIMNALQKAYREEAQWYEKNQPRAPTAPLTEGNVRPGDTDVEGGGLDATKSKYGLE
jgi:hypothetical protein